MHQESLPTWLYHLFWGVLTTGELYPQIRAISVGFTKKGELVARYYLDRKPTEFDWESINEVLSYVADEDIWEKRISSYKAECIFSEKIQKDLENLGGFIYFRREYEMEDNPV